MKAETVNAVGSTSIMTAGADDTDMMIDTSAAGRAAYSLNGSGDYTTTSAAVNGLDPVKVGAMAQHQRINSASNSLGSSTTWNTLSQKIQKDSLTSSEARSFSNRLDNAVRSNWQRSFNDKSSFIHTMEEASRTQFQTTIGVGFSKIISTNGGVQITVIGQDNEKVSFNVSEDAAKFFAKDEARIHSESLQQTFGDTQGLDYLTNMSKQIGATEAYSYLNDAKEMRRSTESYGADLTTSLVRNYATERYGNESSENIRHAISDFDHFLTQQGSQGVNNMHDIINGFVSGNGYGWGNTANEVNGRLAILVEPGILYFHHTSRNPLSFNQFRAYRIGSSHSELPLLFKRLNNITKLIKR